MYKHWGVSKKLSSFVCRKATLRGLIISLVAPMSFFFLLFFLFLWFEVFFGLVHAVTRLNGFRDMIFYR